MITITILKAQKCEEKENVLRIIKPLFVSFVPRHLKFFKNVVYNFVTLSAVMHGCKQTVYALKESQREQLPKQVKLQ